MSKPRGPYAKTSAKRQQIIDAALAAYAEAGSRNVSLRDIAQRVGMTYAGVMHHFGSKEALLTAVLEARDAVAEERFGPEPGTTELLSSAVLRHNASTPGLVKLFVDLVAAAAEPDHPAHDFFEQRYERFRGRLAERIERSVADPAEVDAAWLARIFIAAADGIQLQWLLDPDIDMAADIERLGGLLVGPHWAAGSVGSAGSAGEGPTPDAPEGARPASS
ncbi:TetR/AcrR family transcriptional regulator [Kitasatospora sp. NPDC008115]|uniref:TetR/AcrR family transcriptional regulator n=1 Tax=Kitasatospora sp. NPDC008115 TaxID=3364022 RepID=UPI0036E42C4B